MNEKRVFSDQRVLDRIKELDVLMVIADMTENDEVIAKDLERADRYNIPVNIVYPADPDAPAVLLEELISPEDTLKALNRVAEGASSSLVMRKDIQ